MLTGVSVQTGEKCYTRHACDRERGDGRAAWAHVGAVADSRSTNDPIKRHDPFRSSKNQFRRSEPVEQPIQHVGVNSGAYGFH